VFEDKDVQWLRGRIEQLEQRVTWLERLLMTEGRELFSDTATHISHWQNKDV
jgi:hypothetical protein